VKELFLRSEVFFQGAGLWVTRISRDKGMKKLGLCSYTTGSPSAIFASSVSRLASDKKFWERQHDKGDID
jgi:hypothetical protein